MIRGQAEILQRANRLASARQWSKAICMSRPSPLDDPANARNAWARYRRLMRWMALLSLATAIIGIVGLRLAVGETVTIHMMIATAAGMGGAVMLTAALMGLVFLSSGTGHDESIDDPFADLVDR